MMDRFNGCSDSASVWTKVSRIYISLQSNFWANFSVMGDEKIELCFWFSSFVKYFQIWPIP